MPGPEPPVVNGLQIDRSLDFQRRFGRVQTIAWRVLALLPVAAVAGLFGGGLFSQVTTGDAGVKVSYDRFGRRSVDTQLEVTLVRAQPPRLHLCGAPARTRRLHPATAGSRIQPRHRHGRRIAARRAAPTRLPLTRGVSEWNPSCERWAATSSC